VIGQVERDVDSRIERILDTPAQRSRDPYEIAMEIVSEML
jgi:hypothetical protein